MSVVRKPRVSEAVLDSSAILAILLRERVSARVHDVLDGAVMTAVNIAEVLTKLVEADAAMLPEAEALFALFDRIEPFTETHARRAAGLRPRTKEFGLSLGDRACLALALELGAEVYTADQAWAQVEVGCVVHLIREPRDSVQ
jgi:PIN domain nuclease of toxin-antitoxin system